MYDITCVLPGGQGGVHPGKSVSSGRYSTSNFGRLPSSLFTVRRRQYAKIVGVASFYNSRYGNKKRNENGNAKRVRHANNIAKKRRCVRP